MRQTTLFFIPQLLLKLDEGVGNMLCGIIIIFFCFAANMLAKTPQREPPNDRDSWRMLDEWDLRDEKWQGIGAEGITHPAWCLRCALREYPLLRFCPFRFMHGDQNKAERIVVTSHSGGGKPAKQSQVPPPMWGFGRHMCPGRELAKLEMLLFLKAFLAKFDYKLVEEQSFKGVLPTNGPKDRLRVILEVKDA